MFIMIRDFPFNFLNLCFTINSYNYIPSIISTNSIKILTNPSHTTYLTTSFLTLVISLLLNQEEQDF